VSVEGVPSASTVVGRSAAGTVTGVPYVFMTAIRTIVANAMTFAVVSRAVRYENIVFRRTSVAWAYAVSARG